MLLKIKAWRSVTHGLVSFLRRRSSIASNSRAYNCASAALSHSVKRVGTHNGSYHCDEALACFMIPLSKSFYNAQIIRTRDPQVLEGLDAVVDVGGVYDPSRDRYDHHQKGFNEVFGYGRSTKLSSAGLVYKHYGKEIVAKEVQLDEGHPDVHLLFLTVYNNFIEAIDATDNGINQYDTDRPPRFVNNTSLSSRVGRLNLDWTDVGQSPAHENEAFQQAMELAGKEFLERVHLYAKSCLPARSVVMECLSEREAVDPTREIIVLNRSCPQWKLHIFELERELKIDPSIKTIGVRSGVFRQWQSHQKNLKAGNPYHISGGV